MSDTVFGMPVCLLRRHALRAFAGAAFGLTLGVAGGAAFAAQAPAQPTSPVLPLTQPPAQVQPHAPMPPPAGAEPASGTERQVKAAFLYKFLGYTEFPSTAFGDPGSAVLIGIVGSDAMLAELARTVAGRTLNGRPIIVKAVRDGDNPGPLHMLFVAGNDPARVARAGRAAPGALLLVSECEGGLQQGSVINFRMVDEHVRFDVSLDAAEKNNVRLSSRLLSVANHVQKGNI
jgi:hypothetical protein